MTNRAQKETGISLSVIGSVRLRTHLGKTVRLPHKANALIAYFALTKREIESKEFIKGLLWSESNQQRASGSLRQCLKKLNDTFTDIGFKGFDSNGTEIRVDQELIHVDIINIYEELKLGKVPADLTHDSMLQENLLSDLDGQDQSLDAWVYVQRQTWSDKLFNALEERIRSTESNPNAAEYAARLLNSLDPTHEEASRFLIRFYASRGNLGPIMEIYSKLCAELNDKYGAEPSTETVELYLSVQTETFETKNKTTTPTRPKSKKAPIIGINVFQWSGEAKDNSSISTELFRREMTAALSKFREWIVVDTKNRSGTDNHPSEVDYLLDGTCYQVEAYTDILVTLTDAVTGQVWSETPRIETKSWIQAQRTIVSKIAVALNVYLSTARLTNTIAKDGISGTVHETWLRGYQKMLAWNPESDKQAEIIFREIIESSADFAPAYSSLATVLNTKHFKYVGLPRNREDSAIALEFAQKGVELDPMESRTQLALGFSYAMRNQFEQAQLHLTLARELNPYSPVSVVPCAHGLSYCGKHKDATELVDWAESVNWRWMPRFHWGYILCVRFLARDFKKAIDAAKMADGVIVDLHAWHAAALALDGQTIDASIQLKKFLTLAKENWHGDTTPNENSILQWFIECFPIKNDDDLALLKEGVARAGFPWDRAIGTNRSVK